MKIFIDIVGWLGSILVVLSYALTLVKNKDFSTWCILMNLIGGILVAINCFYYKAIPSLVTNVIWSFIALLSIYRAKKQWYQTRRHNRRAHRY
ncbi:CBU_0592 family membrane protein [Leeuwenhoekiella marinoflava]|uniref:CBU-0592-like domain-containing protein n=2 Tax=Leeuwenhoekiella marinoflava TaxID=988 RepID=A0A4Q0PLA0_9FLAO|nr:hypothetical protein [Leeuwenhoekiella marinoflava]RXG27637.1 hypothetical protein DSL99_2861 [Leeuwenhoekiella marinoflava]SHF67691.1 hypothetical protein SAMN02745246_03154 [Leeuwenhoekiella marinoflava DSM 3653]